LVAKSLHQAEDALNAEGLLYSPDIALTKKVKCPNYHSIKEKSYLKLSRFSQNGVFKNGYQNYYKI